MRTLVAVFAGVAFGACTRSGPSTVVAHAAPPAEQAVAAPDSAAQAAPSVAPMPGTAVELGGRTQAGRYQAVLRFTVPRVSELFAAELQVSLAGGAALPEGTTVAVDATMPEHRHGMMTQPVTAAAGPGRWRTEGLKLHMQGTWVFAVAIGGPAGEDRVAVPFEQPPEAAAQ